MINTEGFIQDDVARMARLVKALSGAMDDEDRERTTNELRKMYTRDVAAIKAHRRKKGPPGMQGKGHRMGDDESKKGRKGERSRSRTEAASSSSGPARSKSRPTPFRGTARRLD